jgi:LytS/YehU family sensor histidine kinase
MGTAPSIKKQVKVALYTTPVIAALTMSPIAILGHYSFSTYLLAILFSMSLVLFLWSMNILLWYLGAWSTTKRTLLSILVCISLAIFVVVFLFSGHSSTAVSPQINFHFHLVLFFAINVVIIILQNLAISREKNAAMELENQALKLKNMEAVNQQLKQQIQPHFLFNSLSTLKSLMAANPDSAEDYLIRLSDFLRSSLSSHALHTAPLSDELDLTVNYLEMQKIRFGSALQSVIQVPEEMRTSYYLPAFSVQMLAENAIKHNILTLDRPLVITIAWQEGGIITVSNNLQKKEADTQGTGVGLANLQERYRLLSGNDIVVEEKSGRFSVSIKAIAYETGDH